MVWNSFADFLAMGQHGPYVWGSFVVMAVAMLLEPLLLIKGRKTLIERLKRQIRADKNFIAPAKE
jgi:heme exporter protein D